MMLEYKLRDIAQLPFEVLEQAHWRPTEVQLCCKHKPAQSLGPEFRRLRQFWRQKEVFFNFALDGLLLSLRPEELAKFGKSVSGLKFESASLFGGYSMPLKKLIGVPDFLIADGESCILGEIKINAGYDYQQFVKYQTFAVLSRLLDHLPNSFEHLIVVQDTKEDAFIKDYGKSWTPKVVKSELQLDSSLSSRLAEDVRQNIALLGQKLNKPTELKSIIGTWSDGDFHTPTTVLVWNDFAERLIKSTGRIDLENCASTVSQLGMGIVEIDRDC